MVFFGGSHLGNKINEYPKSWFKNAKISRSFDINFFIYALSL